MKALNIIRELKDKEVRWGGTPFHEFEYNKAISELEALEQNIKDLESQLSSNPLQLTCEGCFYYDKYEHFNYCDGCSRHTNAGSFSELKDKFTKDTK